MTGHPALARLGGVIGAALGVFLMLPPIARSLEATLAGHMLVQIPLLAVTGALLAHALAPRCRRWNDIVNENGWPGMVAAASLTLYWMLPRALDTALFRPDAEFAKFLSVPAIGALVVLSWPRLGFVGKAFVLFNAISMFAAEGWLYLIAPVRLCNAYLIDDQGIVGWAFLGLAGALLTRVLWRAVVGPILCWLVPGLARARPPIVPAAFFGFVLGLAGLGNCWRIAAQIWGTPAWIGEAVLLFAATVWFTLLVLFVAKWLFATEAAVAEIRHPVQSCYVGLVFVTTLLVSVAAAPYSRTLALGLAMAGWLGHIVFSASITGSLWRAEREPGMTTAVLYLPTVAGNFVGAIAAGNLGFPQLGMLFLGAGLLSWLAIESVLMHSMYTTGPSPLATRPSLGIQLAPPVVCCVAYLSVNGGVPDTFAQMLFGYGLLQAGVMIRLLPWFGQQAFVPGHWAFSFGVVALPLSALRMVQNGMDGPIGWLALPLFACANVIIAYLVLRTAWLLVTGRLLPVPAAAAPQAPQPARAA